MQELNEKLNKKKSLKEKQKFALKHTMTKWKHSIESVNSRLDQAEKGHMKLSSRRSKRKKNERNEESLQDF